MSEARGKAAPDWVGQHREHDGDCFRLMRQGGNCRSSTSSFANSAILLASPAPQRSSTRRLPPSFKPNVPSAARNAASQDCLRRSIGFRVGHQHADRSQPVCLLRARHKRPCCRRTAEQPDEFPSLHELPQVDGHKSTATSRRPHPTTPPALGAAAQHGERGCSMSALVHSRRRSAEREGGKRQPGFLRKNLASRLRGNERNMLPDKIGRFSACRSRPA
jgi:hypothetical protein